MKRPKAKQPQDAAGGAGTSMSRWCSELVKANNRMAAYSQRVAEEEAGKSVRMARVLAVAGIAPHPQFAFSLPSERVALLEKCRDLEKDGWLLTIRVADVATAAVVYRVLDSDARSVESGLRELDDAQQLRATVTPNRLPTVSGTVLADHGDALLEMVYGPHHWLTKAPPDGTELERCWLVFPQRSVRYSTIDPAHREVLYRHLSAMIRIGLGMRLTEFARTGGSLYVEFQWDSKAGYKFFDISFDGVWTTAKV